MIKIHLEEDDPIIQTLEEEVQEKKITEIMMNHKERNQQKLLLSP